MLSLFVWHAWYLRHLLNTEDDSQHCFGGEEGGKYRILLKKLKVSQDFWPGLSESHFHELWVTLLPTSAYTLWQSDISNCACLHQKTRINHPFPDFCERFSIFSLPSFWRRQSKKWRNFVYVCKTPQNIHVNRCIPGSMYLSLELPTYSYVSEHIMY